MQMLAAPPQVQSLYHDIDRSTVSHEPITTICARETGEIYVYPQTQIAVQFAEVLRPAKFTVAIKTRPLSIQTLLAYSPFDTRELTLEDGLVLPVLNTVSSVVGADGEMAAIVRDEEAFVLLFMGRLSDVKNRYSELLRLLDRAAIRVKLPMFARSSSPLSPFSTPLVVSESWQLPCDDCLPLPSLSELDSLHGFEYGPGHMDLAAGYPSYAGSYDGSSNLSYTLELYNRHFSAPSSPFSSPSTSSCSSQSTPITVCLSDISPPPPVVHVELPDDIQSVPQEEDSDIHTAESAEESVARRISPLPKRARRLPGSPRTFTSSVPSSPISTPSGSPQAHQNEPLSPPSANLLVRKSGRSATTTSTPLFEALAITNSPLGTKRKSVSPSPRSSPPCSPIAGPSSMKPTNGRSHRGSPDVEDGAEIDTEDGESDLSDFGPDDEDEDDEDEDDYGNICRAVKRTKVAYYESANPASIAPAIHRVSKKRNTRGGQQKKKKFSCDCGTKFTREADRRRHQTTHACPIRVRDAQKKNGGKEPEKAHLCQICGTKFHRVDALRRHVKQSHRRYY